jgi:hypothetical protein
MLKPRPKAQGKPATTMRGPYKFGFFLDSTVLIKEKKKNTVFSFRIGGKLLCIQVDYFTLYYF